MINLKRSGMLRMPCGSGSGKWQTVCCQDYVLDGNLFVDIGHTTVQFEHHEQAQQIRVIEPVHDLHQFMQALVDDARLVLPMRQLVDRADRVALWTAKLNLKSAE